MTQSPLTFQYQGQTYHAQLTVAEKSGKLFCWIDLDHPQLVRLVGHTLTFIGVYGGHFLCLDNGKHRDATLLHVLGDDINRFIVSWKREHPGDM